MVKEKYRILVLLSKIVIFLFASLNTAITQKFTFESDVKNESVNYTSKLDRALSSDNSVMLKKILSKNRKLVNAASFKKKSKFYRFERQKIHLINDVTIRCLMGDVGLDLVKTVLSFDPNMYSDYGGSTAFYYILDYLAETEISNSSDGLKLFHLFVSKSNFEISRRYKTLEPPLSYILSKNYNYQGQYSHNYIADSVIESFIMQGSDVNTFDRYGNNLLLFAFAADRINLTDLLIDKGANINVQNKNGKDALYFCVKNNNLHLWNKLQESNYKFDLYNLQEMGIKEFVPMLDKPFYESLLKTCISKFSTFDDVVTFIEIFPIGIEDIFKSEYFHLWSNQLETNNFPRLQDLLDEKEIKLEDSSQTNLNKLEYRYIKEAPLSKNISAEYSCRIYYEDSNEIFRGEWSGECENIYNEKFSENIEWANGYGNFTFISESGYKWTITGKFINGRIDGLSTENDNSQTKYSYFIDGLRDGIVTSIIKSRNNPDYPISFLVSYAKGIPDGDIGVAVYENGQVSKLEHLGDNKFTTSRINYGNYYPVKLFIEGIKCYALDKVSSLPNSKLGKAVVSNILSSLILDEDFRIENLAKSHLKSTFKSELKKNGLENFADLIDMNDLISCMFN